MSSTLRTSTRRTSTLRRPTSGGPTPCKRAGAKALGAAVAAAMLAAAAHSGPASAAAHPDAVHTEAPYSGAARPKLVLSGYEDRAAGATLLAGHYSIVIEELGSHGPSFARDTVAASTNLCIAYIMTARWSAAHPACDEAIALAELDVPQRDLLSREMHSEQIAVAYSNRAVLHWLESRPASAAEDLSKARTLAQGSEAVSQNLAALRSRSGAGVLAATGK